ncbi:unnamed protein product [Oppiella nova]|uniref:Uncharacterized protein n=1 Tax=Oppiella nova TaxID=334625 RepID=A0A7R9LP09_9ACAR|nr:unnamed protein product [Oppiella nova]CAG2165554.1 unnamed protein product [Oppiella nova]
MVKESGLYDLLGVRPDCSEPELRKAYKTLALRYHPDRNPDPSESDQFKHMSRAYEVLSNPDKRQAYDTGGEEALNGAGGQPTDPMDLFRHMFGTTAETTDRIIQLKVTLEELYNRSVRRLRYKRNARCLACDGKGCRDGRADQPCRKCAGSGIQQLIPGMFRECMDCKGEGRRLAPGDECQACAGRQIFSERRVIDVHVDRGMADEQKITVREAGDWDTSTGRYADLVVALDQQQHPVFRRCRRDDLGVTLELTLTEALCGFRKAIKTLDNRTLVLDSSRLAGQVIKHGSIKCVPGEGMPRFKDPFEKGRLLVKFDVKFPDSLSAEQIQELRATLPPPPAMETNGAVDVEEATLEDLRVEPERDEQYVRCDHNSDDDEQQVRGGMSCVPQ